MENFKDFSLDDAKTWLWTRVKKGAECPCCTQLAKVYKRRVNSSLALSLISLSKLGDGWHHVSNILALSALRSPTLSREFSIIRYWGLIDEKEVEEGVNSRTSGYWRITAKGQSFVAGQILIPRYAFIFDGRCLYLSEDTATIQECLGSKFNYADLMLGK